jgi:anti-sigma B factor antagonist
VRLSLHLPDCATGAAPAARFDCSPIDDDPDAARLHLAGDLDIATAPALDDALHEAVALAPLVVLDLRDLDFVDVAGVRAVAKARARARRAGRQVVVLRGSPSVDRVFSLTQRFAADQPMSRP